MDSIPYGRQDIDESDIQRVVEVLRSDFLTQGPAIPRFEKAVARYCGVEHAVAVCNATAALHLACLALGLKPGDVLWTSPNTFVASANCALYCGAEVDFVDIDSRTLNLDPRKLADKLSRARAEGKRLPKIVVPVHHSGLSCDMAAIHELSREYGFKILEDASHAIGGSYESSKIGSCRYSDAAVFSFHPVKIVTTGEGGMVVARDAAVAESVGRLRTHGITRDPSRMREPSHGSWYYEQIELGFNYRITDLQAALGTAQLEKIDRYVARRNELAARYGELLANLPLKLPAVPNGQLSARHLYVVRVDLDRVKKPKARIFEELHRKGVLVNLHYIPVPLQPYYRERFGFHPGQFPESERYYAEAMSLPLFPTLTEGQQDRVAQALAEVLEA